MKKYPKTEFDAISILQKTKLFLSWKLTILSTESALQGFCIAA